MPCYVRTLLPALLTLLLAACAGSNDVERSPEVTSTPDTGGERTSTGTPTVSPTLSPSATATEPARTATATQTAVPTMRPTAAEMEQATLTVPSQCLPEQGERFPYVNHTAGYCLQYPSSFDIADVFPEGAPNVENILGIYGPAHDASLEPLRAGMNVVVVGPADGRTLQQVVDEAVASAGPDAEITTLPAELDGEPAMILEGMPGRTENRQLLTIHEERVFQLTVYPTGDDFPEVADEVELVWQTALDSFAFLSQDVLDQFAACPEQASPYVDVVAGYCLRYPSEFSVVQTTNPPAVTFADTLLSFDGDQESVRVALTVEMEEVADDRTLQELVDEMAAGYAGAEVGQRPAELGGEAAIIIEGLPEGAGSRQLLALHGGAVYRLTLSSVGDELPEAAAAAERLWEAAKGSFVFLPPAD